MSDLSEVKNLLPDNNDGHPELIIFVSRKNEKLDRHRLALETNNDLLLRRYGLPLRPGSKPAVFVHINEIVKVFRSAPEDKGDRVEHAKQKAEYTDPIVIEARTENSPINQALRRKCEELGCPYNPNKIHFVTNDETMSLPIHVWRHLRPKLAEFVSDQVLEAADNKKDKKKGEEPKEGGPASEVGPIFQNVTVPIFFQAHVAAVQQMIQEEGSRPLARQDTETYQYSTCVVTTLGSPPGAKKKILTVKETQQLYLPHGLETNFALFVDDETLSRIPFSGRYLEPENDLLESRRKNPGYSIQQAQRKYLRSEEKLEDTLHGRMILALLDYVKNPTQQGRDLPLNNMPQRSLKKLVKAAAQQTTRPINTKKLRNHRRKNGLAFKVVQPFWDDTVSIPKLGLNKVKSRAHHREEGASRDEILKEGDAFIFPPFNENNLDLRRRVYLRAVELIEAKTTEAAYTFAPIIFMDDGCYTPLLKMLRLSSRLGMLTNFDRDAYDQNLPSIPFGVTHARTDIYDAVLCSDKSPEGKNKLVSTTDAVLNYRQEHFVRHSLAKDGPKAPYAEGQESIGFEKPRVAGFTSASNDNINLIKTNFELTYLLAREGFPFLYGAGDRYGMGAFKDGYQAGREKNERDARENRTKQVETHLTGVSTYSLITQESKHNTIPAECDYSVLYADIYSRRNHLINKSDFAYATPGGVGTFDEVLKFVESGKPFVFVDVDLHNNDKSFWKPFIKSNFGTEFRQKLVQDGRVGNIFFAKNVSEAMIHFRTISNELNTQPIPPSSMKPEKVPSAESAPTVH